MRNCIYIIVFLFFLFACKKEHFYNGSDINLKFSSDTISFDTVFTSLRTITKRLIVYNNYDETVKISSIWLGAGNQSSYTINVDGEIGKNIEDVTIGPKDSLYVFIQSLPPENGKDLPKLIKDSLFFKVNQNIQDVKIKAYHQDVFLMNNLSIKSQVWSGDKPYLIYGTLTLDSLEILTIHPGVVIYMHKGANIRIRGRIQASGSFEKPIKILGDRFDEDYKDIPGQWGGIYINSGNDIQQFNWIIIKNGTTGLQIGDINYSNYRCSVVLKNVIIQNMAYACLIAYNAEIDAGNCLIANAKFYTCYLAGGGEYQFYHTTIANYYSIYDYREYGQPALYISNFITDNTNTTAIDLSGSFFRNSVIYGNAGNELSLEQKPDKEFNISFDYCLIKGNTKNTYPEKFTNCIWNEDPKFKDTEKLNFELDTLSPAKDAGGLEWGGYYPYDLLNKFRMSDQAPDLGAFERYE